MGTIVFWILLLIPAGALAEPNYGAVRASVLATLGEKGPQEALALAETKLGKEWCMKTVPPALLADVVSIARRAGAKRKALRCALALLDQPRYYGISDSRVESGLWFEASMALQTATAEDLDWLAQVTNFGGGVSAYDRIKNGCGGVRLILDGQGMSPIVEWALVDLVKEFKKGERHAALVSLIAVMKKGDEAGKVAVSRLRQSLAKEFRRRAYLAAPSAVLRDRMKGNGEDVSPPPGLLLVRRTWETQDPAQQTELEARAKSKRFTVHVRSTAWNGDFVHTSYSDQRDCTASDVIVVQTDGEVFWSGEPKGGVNGSAHCSGYGDSYAFEAEADTTGKTFSYSSGTSWYINDVCGPVGGDSALAIACERTASSVECVEHTRFVRFEVAKDGVFRARLSSIPRDLAHVFESLTGMTPAQVFDEVPRIHAQVRAFAAGTEQ